MDDATEPTPVAEPIRLRPPKCCFQECQNPALTDGDWKGFCAECARALAPDVYKCAAKIEANRHLN
jgi:predicted amidophosphoribosyltransferase